LKVEIYTITIEAELGLVRADRLGAQSSITISAKTVFRFITSACINSEELVQM
jgi:hypothetical protein